MTEPLTLDASKLTGRQALFLTDTTGRTISGFIQLLEDLENASARDLLALAAVATNPDDPQAAFEELLDEEITVIGDRARAALD